MTGKQSKNGLARMSSALGAVALIGAGLAGGVGVWAAEPIAPTLQTPTIHVLPWNGAKGAVSFTFDDGDKSQLSQAIPELDKRKIRATFFLHIGAIDDFGPWKQADAAGHEIGSHGVTHKHITPADEERDVSLANTTLVDTFGHPIWSFAYPFCEAPASLQQWVGKFHIVARGGGGSGKEPDWLNLPAFIATADKEIGPYQTAINEALGNGSWSVFMFHGIGWGTGGLTVKTATLAAVLDYVQGKDLWVAPFGEVGAYARAQQIVEKAPAKTANNGTTWEWTVPAVFPKGVVLKIKVDSGKQLAQKEFVIKPDANGICLLRFDDGSASVK